ncbi:MAG: 4Fe-4S single cluster domain-containing protein [Desulfuromonadaceae bacterium]|nr:4Fe-4S single cluster domain-containing protein [Desulfuromonadaceae bacterium]
MKSLGYGQRVGVWLQGCPIRCSGCISTDTWADDPEREMPIEMLLEWCRDITNGIFDGVTITGGEPFHQPKALCALLEGLRHLRLAISKPFDIICYSGFELEYLESQFPAILSLIDAIIPGPFLENRPKVDSLCGSDNQNVFILSSLGKERYGNEASREAQAHQMQVSSDSEGIWFVGIPNRGDMVKVESLCAGKGLNMGEVSWGK